MLFWVFKSIIYYSVTKNDWIIRIYQCKKKTYTWLFLGVRTCLIQIMQFRFSMNCDKRILGRVTDRKVGVAVVRNIDFNSCALVVVDFISRNNITVRASRKARLQSQR